VKNWRLYAVSAVRLLLVPAATILILSLLPYDVRIRETVLIAAAAPVGANVAIYAQLNGRDYTYACQTVVMSTLLSIATMPAVMALAERVL
jgi:predicted permease